jgi:hypothetical protein
LDNSLRATSALELIMVQVARLLNRERTDLVTQADPADVGFWSMIQQA